MWRMMWNPVKFLLLAEMRYGGATRGLSPLLSISRPQSRIDSPAMWASTWKSPLRFLLSLMQMLPPASVSRSKGNTTTTCASTTRSPARYLTREPLAGLWDEGRETPIRMRNTQILLHSRPKETLVILLDLRVGYCQQPTAW